MKWQIWIIIKKKSSILFLIYDILTGMKLCRVCFVILFIFSKLIVFCLFRFDADDCEVDSDGEDDEVNGNEDGEGGGNEEDSEEG